MRRSWRAMGTELLVQRRTGEHSVKKPLSEPVCATARLNEQVKAKVPIVGATA
jgi:hypothetical protein